ncbi:hypothetical protein BDY21DRAFT_332382 [Lineolata rhizophorae]|uniref:Uncharacterized protein n=1 Tax=Lineolata rhizophorae TaxID=578093 RepID=A0A6A6PC10_9PEZI|nr:hypothetical protein BDY21DRAFT_332382 [Lineolata rhizophorae]
MEGEAGAVPDVSSRAPGSPPRASGEEGEGDCERVRWRRSPGERGAWCCGSRGSIGARQGTGVRCVPSPGRPAWPGRCGAGERVRAPTPSAVGLRCTDGQRRAVLLGRRQRFFLFPGRVLSGGAGSRQRPAMPAPAVNGRNGDNAKFSNQRKRTDGEDSAPSRRRVADRAERGRLRR